MIKVKPYNVADIDHNIKSNLINTILKVFFIILHIIFGLDYGFIKYKKPRHTLIVKILISAYIVFVNYQSFILFSNETKMFGLESVWYLKHLIENLIYIAILAFIPHHKSFFTFLVHLELIDSKIGARSSKYFCFKIIICCLISLTFKFISTITYCLRYEECAANIWLHTVSTIPSFSIDLPFIVIFFTFHLVSCRLVAIQKCIQNKKLETIEIQRIYKSLVDLTETAKKSFDPLLIITLLFNVPSVMIIIYEILKDAKINTQASYVMESITIVSLVIVIFAPSIAASSLSTDVDKIKRTLYNTMLDESDQNKLQDIQRFINYTEARPFKFHVLKIVPLDATLPIVIINLCITYLIVILQLTHLY